MTSHGKLSQASAKELLEDLDEIRCPFTCDIDAAFIGNVLFQSNEHRLQILKWMFKNIHPEIQAIMKSTKSLPLLKHNLPIDSEIQILTSLASTMCLCSPAEFDLIKGDASMQRQLVFWRQLIQIIKEINKDCPGRSEIMEKVLETSDIGRTVLDTINSTTSLIPPDIKKSIHITQKVVDIKKMKASPYAELELQLTNLTDFLENEKVYLKKLETDSRCQSGKEDPITNVTTVKSYKLHLVDLMQMFDAFQEIFLNSYQPLCKRKPEQFSNLGEIIHDITKLLTQLSKTLENLKKINQGYDLIIPNDITVVTTKIIDNKVTECLEKLHKTLRIVSNSDSTIELSSHDYSSYSMDIIGKNISANTPSQNCASATQFNHSTVLGNVLEMTSLKF